MARAYVGRLPIRTRESDLFSVFKNFGRIVYIEIRGYTGFVQFERSEDMHAAVNKLRGNLSINNVPVAVDICLSRLELHQIHSNANAGGLKDSDYFSVEGQSRDSQNSLYKRPRYQSPSRIVVVDGDDRDNLNITTGGVAQHTRHQYPSDAGRFLVKLPRRHHANRIDVQILALQFVEA